MHDSWEYSHPLMLPLCQPPPNNAPTADTPNSLSLKKRLFHLIVKRQATGLRSAAFVEPVASGECGRLYMNFPHLYHRHPCVFSRASRFPICLCHSSSNQTGPWPVRFLLFSIHVTAAFSYILPVFLYMVRSSHVRYRYLSCSCPHLLTTLERIIMGPQRIWGALPAYPSFGTIRSHARLIMIRIPRLVF